MPAHTEHVGGNLDERVSVITDYIKFRISTTIPDKTFKKYPDSKCLITNHNNYGFKGKTVSLLTAGLGSFQKLSSKKGHHQGQTQIQRETCKGIHHQPHFPPVTTNIATSTLSASYLFTVLIPLFKS